MKPFCEILISDLNKKLARLFRQASHEKIYLSSSLIFVQKCESSFFLMQLGGQIMYKNKASIQIQIFKSQSTVCSAMRIILNSKYDISILQRISN